METEFPDEPLAEKVLPFSESSTQVPSSSPRMKMSSLVMRFQMPTLLPIGIMSRKTDEKKLTLTLECNGDPTHVTKAVVSCSSIPAV